MTVSSVAVRAGQHDYRHLHPGRRSEPAQLSPVHIGQPDVEQDGIETFDR